MTSVEEKLINKCIVGIAIDNTGITMTVKDDNNNYTVLDYTSFDGSWEVYEVDNER